jgi:hypothetical protein
MSFAADGRAVFAMQFSSEREGYMHVTWLRIGDHSVLDNPQG